MSAFVCSDLHINTLVSFAVKHEVRVTFRGETLDAETGALRLAGLLYTANVESVNTRYREDDDSSAFRFEPVRVLPSAVAIMKLCQCLAYQSCEIAGYEDTIGARIIQAIIGAAISELPGYDKAPWAIG